MQTTVKVLPLTEDSIINPDTPIQIPANFLPNFRSHIAIQRKVHQNLMLKTWGGLGDQLCAEPTLRFALKNFQGVDISLASEKPELFKHLKFDRVYDLNEVTPNYNKYLVFETITPPDNTNLVWQFFSHMLTNCVDFASLCALRCQLPIGDREIYCSSQMPSVDKRASGIYIHAGRHWPSKTFPKEWWDKVISAIKGEGVLPILIGANTDDNRGTVDVDATHCLDLRNKTTVSELAWLLQRAQVLLTNDSSPLHFAASTDPVNPANTGLAWIGYIATCKHPDYITHWRKGAWQWREVNHGKGGIWEITDHCPNANSTVTVDNVDPELLRSWLPDPISYAHWALDKYFEGQNL